ncbi:MAG: sugar phosphate isomerase/epimerase family protein [Ruminiclostridium sp.]
MKIDIGLQLYSLREKCSENFENVLKAVSNAGYDGVEFYSFFDIEANKMKQMLNNYSLKSMGTHTSIDVLKNDLDGLMRYSATLGNEYVALAYYASEDRDGWLRLCELLEKSGEQLRRNGFKLMYHNHGHEFEPKFNGEMAEDIILNNTSPENVSLELDCYWVTYAGLNPEEYLKNNLDRIKTIHLKDMDKNEKKMTEVGTGRVNCGGLYDICRKAGFKWVVIEQDDIFIDPYESIKLSIDNTRKF